MLRKIAQAAYHRIQGRRFRPLNRIELSADRLLGNVALVHQQHPGFAIIPVLKGNAYGHGIGPVAGILRGSGCQFIAVDGYFEANVARRHTSQHILVMGYILPENARLLDVEHCSFVVQDIAGLEAFGALRRPVRVHLELNTGFNRTGLQPAELDPYLEALKRYPNLELEGVMTHLADADNEQDGSFNLHQQQAFDSQVERILAAGFRPSLIHIAQTAGSAKIHSQYANAIRLGIGTYGINPLHPDDPSYQALAALRPVLELKSTIVKVLELRQGDKVSYNGTFTAPGPMRVGVLPLGYYEGVPRALGNTGYLTHLDQDLPIVGRVCMNHTMFDLKDSGLQVGDEVTMISRDPARPNSVASLQVSQGLFAYTTITGLASTIRREVIR